MIVVLRAAVVVSVPDGWDDEQCAALSAECWDRLTAIVDDEFVSDFAELGVTASVS